jgi:RHS repeat-associated protein
VTTYAYDALGDRVTTTANGVVRHAIYDDQHGRHLVLDAQGNLLSRYVNRDAYGSELAVSSGGAWTYPVLDFQRTAVASTNASGAVVARYRYGAFGTGGGSAEAEAQWHGLTPGADGALLSWARPYDPALGRFASEDPVDAPNLYGYGEDNPCQKSDPLGLQNTIETTIKHCKALQQLFKAMGVRTELHHVISAAALRIAGRTSPLVLALLPVLVHRATNTWGSSYDSRMTREFEALLLQTGGIRLAIEAQKALLVDLLQGAVLILCKG